MNKKEIRQQFKALRQTLSASERETMSLRLMEHTLQEVELEGKNVSIFLPIERFAEINTWHFFDRLPHTKFILPVVKSKDVLSHIQYESKAQIEVSKWGIPEPVYGESVDPLTIDVVLVPLLAIDQNGYRVGYGKGFYDQFLSQCKPDCKFIGLSYFPPLDEVIEDLHENDIPLHVCITPDQVIYFNSKN